MVTKKHFQLAGVRTTKSRINAATYGPTHAGYLLYLHCTFPFSIPFSSNYFVISDFVRNLLSFFFAMSIRIGVLASLNIAWILFVYCYCDYFVSVSVFLLLLLLLLLLYCLHIL